MGQKPIAAVDGNYDLGDTSTGNVGTKVIEINYGSTPMVGNFLVQGRLAGGGGTFVAIPYRKRYLNAAVGDDSFVSTTITGNSLIEVNAAGLEIRLNWDYTSGAIGTGAVINWLDLIG